MLGFIFPFRTNPDPVNHKQVRITDFYGVRPRHRRDDEENAAIEDVLDSGSAVGAGRDPYPQRDARPRFVRDRLQPADALRPRDELPRNGEVVGRHRAGTGRADLTCGSPRVPRRC